MDELEQQQQQQQPAQQQPAGFGAIINPDTGLIDMNATLISTLANLGVILHNINLTQDQQTAIMTQQNTMYAH